MPFDDLALNAYVQGTGVPQIGGMGSVPNADLDHLDDDDDTPDTPEPAYRPSLYQPSRVDQEAPPRQSFLQRAGHTAYEFGKGFLRDMNVFESGISTRERLFRVANDAAFFLPPLKIGMTAGLGVRALVRGAEMAAVGGGLAAIRGDPILPTAALSGGIGAGIEALLSRGRFRGVAQRAAAAASHFANPAAYADIATTPLHHQPWAVIGGQLVDGTTGVRLNDTMNAARHAKLGDDLSRLGYQPLEAKGMSPAPAAAGNALPLTPAPSVEVPQYLVPGIDRQSALELAKSYGQKHVLTHEGLFDLDAQNVAPINRAKTRFGNSINPASDTFVETPHGSFTFEHDAPVDFSGNAILPISGAEARMDALRGAESPGVVDKLLNYPISGAVHSWYIKTVRSFAEVERMEKVLGKPDTGLSPSELIQLSAGSSGYASHAITDGVPDWLNRVATVHKPLRDILEQLQPGEFDALDRYGYAKYFRHLALDRTFSLPKLPNGQQLQLSDLDAIIHKTETQLPHLQQIRDGVQAWREAMMKETLVKSGVISEDTFNAIVNSSDEFVPVRRAFDAASEQMRLEHTFDSKIMRDPIDRIGPLRGKFAPWLDSVVRDSFVWSKLAHEQDFITKLVQKLEAEDPSAAALFAKRVNLPPGHVARWQSEAVAQLAQTDPALAVNAEKIGSEMADLLVPARAKKEGIIGALLPTETKFFRNRLTGEELLPHQWDAQVASGKIANGTAFDEITKTVPTRQWWQVTNPDLWEAFHTMMPAQQNMFVKLSAGVASVLRTGATLSFEFLARNPIKDIWTAQTLQNSAGLHDYMKGFASAFNKDGAYQQWLAAGGGRATFVGMDRDATRDMLSTAINDANHTGLGKVWNVIKSPLDSLQQLSDVLESGTRVGVFNAKYQQLVANGMAPEEAVRRAALSSRQTTVDFAIHGSRTQAVRSIAAFWNAGLQGYDNLVRQFHADPAGAALRASAYITVPSVGLYFINRQDPEYFQLPEWERNIFWHVKVPQQVPWLGDKWMRIPKPFDLGMFFGTAPERFLQWMDDNDKSAVDGMAHNYLSKVAGDAIPWPTIAKPIIESAINKSFITDRPVESRALGDVAPEYRLTGTTTEIAQAMGKWLGISPIQVDHYLGGYFGGLGRLGTSLADVAVNMAQGEVGAPVFDPSKMPGLRGLFSQFPRQAEPVDKFYEAADSVRQAEATRAKLESTLRIDDLIDWMEQKAIPLGLADTIKDAQGTLKQLRDQRDMVLADKTMPRQQRAQMLDTISRQMLDFTAAYKPVIDMLNNPQNNE